MNNPFDNLRRRRLVEEENKRKQEENLDAMRRKKIEEQREVTQKISELRSKHRESVQKVLNDLKEAVYPGLEIKESSYLEFLDFPSGSFMTELPEWSIGYTYTSQAHKDDAAVSHWGARVIVRIALDINQNPFFRCSGSQFYAGEDCPLTESNLIQALQKLHEKRIANDGKNSDGR